MKRLFAYMINDMVHIQAMSSTQTTGLWIAYGEVFSAQRDDLMGLDVIIHKAFANSITNVPHPAQSEWKNVQRPMLKVAGVRTWKAMAKKAKVVSIKLDDNMVHFIPVRDYKSYGGEGIIESAIILDLSSKHLGKGLIDAFAHAS